MAIPPPPQGWRRVFLLRHGETHANEQGLVQGSRINAKLNHLGQNQALGLGKFFEPYKIGVLCTSALERARETASHICGCGIKEKKVLTLAELNEMDYGATWDGKHLSTVFRDLRTISKRWSDGDTSFACPDGGESPDDVLKRSLLGLREVVDQMSECAEDEVAVIIAHNFVNKILLSHILNGKVSELQRIQQDHACINVMNVHPGTGEVEVIHVNLGEHLARL